jgi:hypothetical protein
MLPAIWIVTLLGVTLWSLLCWGLHALLAVDPLWVEDVEALIREVPFATWSAHWVPGWHEMLNVAMDLTSVVLSWVGSNAPLVAWIVWIIGTLVLIGQGMLLTLIVCLLRESRPTPSSAAQTAAAAKQASSSPVQRALS